MNSSKCPTKSLIKKGDVVLSGSFAWRYSLSHQYKRTLEYLAHVMLRYIQMDRNLKCGPPSFLHMFQLELVP